SGRRVYEGTLEVDKRTNEEVTTAFPVSEAIGRLEPGIYVLAAAPVEEGRKRNADQATQWFIVTDIGLQTFSADDGLHVNTRSLATAQPKAGVRVRLVAKNNEVLAETTSGADGFARFDAALLKGDGAQAPQLVTAEVPGTDYAFLDIAQAAFDLTDRGVKGRAAPGAIDAFAYTDRGVYRPGETVHFATLVRDRAARASNVPVTAIITRPDGVEHARVALTDQGLGGRVHPLKLGRGAMTGTWRVKVHTDPKAQPITQAAFLVEDFVPEKMELTLTPAVSALSLERGGAIDLAGRYLYGPPAAGLAVEGEVIIKASKTGLAAFPGYRFGATGEKHETVRQAFENLGTTGADGKLRVDLKLPQVNRTALPLEADVILKLRETGGRTIERVVSLPVSADIARIGVKPRFEGTNVREGSTATFDVIHLAANGTRAPLAGAQWELLKLEQRWQWYNRSGNWSYDVHTDTTRVAGGAVDIKADAPTPIEARVDWGRYRLVVKSADGQVVTSMNFDAGYWAEEGADSPETLDVALDKKSYRAGETARVKIGSRMAGRALITVMSGAILDKREVDVPAGGGDVEIPVKADWGPGAYIGVTLFRPLDQPQKRMPGRALGLQWLTIDQTPRRIDVKIDAPKDVKPGAPLVVPLTLAGLAPGEEARVTVSAVDVGILNLTRFETPKPETWFHGQRKLGIDVRDYYSRLIDGMRAEKGRLRSGGDGTAADAVSAQGSPPVEALLAEFSGIVKVGPDGKAEVKFDLPQFNGTVRLTAVAWTADKVGSGSADTLVRDAVAVTVASPRFLTMGDKARIAFDLHNVGDAPRTFVMNLRREGLPVALTPVALTEKRITLAPGQKITESITYEAKDVGVQPITLALTG
ncbi:MAG: hypothetical protein RL291_647, partial [Pseudomonadota bacterium]